MAIKPKTPTTKKPKLAPVATFGYAYQEVVALLGIDQDEFADALSASSVSFGGNAKTFFNMMQFEDILDDMTENSSKLIGKFRKLGLHSDSLFFIEA